SEVRAVGVYNRVVKADVESLYPSLMLTHHIGPASDSLGIFLPGLRDLTLRRLEAKRRAAESLKTPPQPSPSQGEGALRRSSSPSQGEGALRRSSSPSQGESVREPSPPPYEGESHQTAPPPYEG